MKSLQLITTSFGIDQLIFIVSKQIFQLCRSIFGTRSILPLFSI